MKTVILILVVLFISVCTGQIKTTNQTWQYEIVLENGMKRHFFLEGELLGSAKALYEHYRAHVKELRLRNVRAEIQYFSVPEAKQCIGFYWPDPPTNPGVIEYWIVPVDTLLVGSWKEHWKRIR